MTQHDLLISAAAEALCRGELVAFPTETVYGLGANAADEAAIARLYAAKGRPTNHPVIVHIARFEHLQHWVREIPPAAGVLAAACWPGPLTLVLPRAPQVLDSITGGQDTVAVRCPSHPTAIALLEACAARGVWGLVAPSANRFGRISPTTAAHVTAEFGATLAQVLDGGPCAVGIESTIVDVSGATPRVLRPGMLSADRIASLLATPLAAADAAAPRVSGGLTAHYAPRTPLQLLDAAGCAARADALIRLGHRVAVLASAHVLAGLGKDCETLPAADAPAAYAQTLYANVRTLDALGCVEILVEHPPPGPDWAGIHDRLNRAAAGAGQADAG